jgi:hypothetical protein
MLVDFLFDLLGVLFFFELPLFFFLGSLFLRRSSSLMGGVGGAAETG